MTGSWKARVSALAVGLLIAVAVAESALRVASTRRSYDVIGAGLVRRSTPAAGAMPGIEGPSVYSTNAIGVRGDPYAPEGRLNLLAIGGSATQCKYLDDSEAWPYLVQQKLNDEGREVPVWVGNIGRSGHGLVEHLLQLSLFVPQYSFDAVIVLVGVNDFLPVVRDPASYDAASEDPADLDRFLDRSFTRRPFVDRGLPRPFPQSLAVWNAGEILWRRIAERAQARTTLLDDAAGRSYIRRRQLLAGAPLVLDRLPDLDPSLERYEANLRKLAATSRSLGVGLVLVTQPVLWAEELSPAAERLLWLGYYGEREAPAGRYRPAVLLEGMTRFNERLLSVCREQELFCFDLASEMSGNESFFFDDVHFTELGSARAASLLADYLSSIEVLSTP